MVQGDRSCQRTPVLAEKVEFSYPMDRTLSLQIALPLAMRDWLNEFMHSILRISKKSTLAEQRLRQSEERFMKAFHASPLPISISTQAEARFVDVNDAFLHMLGFERQQVIGNTAGDLDFWADPSSRTRMLTQLGEGKGVKMMPARFRTRSGEYREGNVSAELIELSGVPCILAITQDLTETKRLEKQLLQAQKMDAIGQMIGGIAHDFNNMLSVIIGHSDLSQQHQFLCDPITENITQIKKAAKRAASFIRQLLAFSSERLFYPRVLDINSVVASLNEMLRHMLGQDIVLTFKPAGASVYINADLGQFEQLLMNVVLNARDAMAVGGQIRVETEVMEVIHPHVDRYGTIPPGQYVALSVTDSGCGMNEKELAHIFEPLFTTKHGGTGLGLATVRQILKRSNGHAWVHSVPGEGTTFRFYFPRIKFPANVPYPQNDESPAIGGTETILVAEDDEPVRRVIAELLRSAGYCVLEAVTPEHAMELFSLNAGRVDLLLTDAVMSEMSGLQLAKKLRVSQPKLKVLLVTGYGPDLIARYGALMSDTKYMEKPFTRDVLLRKVRVALDEEPKREDSLG